MTSRAFLVRFSKLLVLFFCLASCYASELSLEEKIGTLLMPPACPLRGEDHWADWEKLVHEFHISSALVKGADPLSQVQFLNRLQSISPRPFLIAADAEWGLGMHMPGTISFPKARELGTLSLEAIAQIGQAIGRQAQCVGIHLNLAPVADVDNNPKNPIIGPRSFGGDPQHVAQCVAAMIRGLQSGGVLACAKHFPGHGDTEIDSHERLPTVPHSLSRLQEVEIPPFQKAIEEGVACIMTGHLLVPALDPTYPASLSKQCVQGYLRAQLHFDGVVITDALNMGAIATQYAPEEAAILSLQAGSDLLLYGSHLDEEVDEILRQTIPRVYRAILDAYLTGRLDLCELDQKIERIARAKQRFLSTN